jgi:hypothetical protein
MNLIITAAGQSTRFPKMRPKWMLTHPNGNLMLAESITGLSMPELEHIYLVVLAAHLEQYQCLDGIVRQFQQIGLSDKLVVTPLQQPTRSQPETVAKAIEQHSIAGPICIKDTDNFFKAEIPNSNFVCVADLNNMNFVNPRNKSYASINEDGVVTNIVEKQVISSTFCCGAYGFADAKEYLQYFHAMKHHENLYISHIIYKMILDNRAFSVVMSRDYCDWGTLKDWNRYKSGFGTIFIDLDGVLVINSGEYFAPLWGSTKGIADNIAAVNRLYDSGKVQIIITTSRREELRQPTIEQLSKEGVKYHQILFGMHHGKRIVVNDYAPSNPFKSCDSVNIARDSATLAEQLESVIFAAEND